MNKTETPPGPLGSSEKIVLLSHLADDQIFQLVLFVVYCLIQSHSV